MAHGQSHHRTGEVTRNGASRFAQVLAGERATEQLLAALRVAIHSSCQRDRSAAQAVADAFRVDLATVYRWVNGELTCRPLQDFLDLQDAILAAKGDANPAALELVRYVRRRYLETEVEPPTTGALVGGVGDLLRRASVFTAEAMRAVDPNSDGGEEIDPETELPGLEVLLDELDRAVRTLRPRVQARAGRGLPRRVEVSGGDR